jgi:phosphoglycolate phosphatase-like HAD superfamily hydrolase
MSPTLIGARRVAPRLKEPSLLDPAMPEESPKPPYEERRLPPPSERPLEGLELPMISATSQFAEVGHTVGRPEGQVAPVRVERGVVVFDLDGTILDDLALISVVAADVLFKAFATPPEEGRIHYLATTGMPFEAQLAQLYPQAPAPLRAATAVTFHQRKVTEAYAKAKPFPEIPKLLKRLGSERWTLAVSTGAETEMADLLLEREGLRYWFEEVLGSAEGTKREHLAEYRRRYPSVPMFLVGDSRFDMEAAQSVPGVTSIGRASTLKGWGLTPLDLERWGAKWADYTLSGLPEVLARLERPRPAKGPSRTGRRARKP